MRVKKRNGTYEEFNLNKILNALHKAFDSCNYHISSELLEDMTSDLDIYDGIDIEDIQNQLEEILLDWDYHDVHFNFHDYRLLHTEMREQKMLEQMEGLFDQSDEYLMKENANKRPEYTNVQQSYLGGIASTTYCRTKLFPKYILEGHDKGAYHIHDIDMSAMPGITNCSLLDLRDALSKGTVMNEVGIDAQSKFVTACTVATQVVQGVAGLQYGGITVTMSHLAPYLRMSAEKIRNDIFKYKISDGRYFDDKYHEVLTDGVQTFMYQVNSMMTTQG